MAPCAGGGVAKFAVSPRIKSVLQQMIQACVGRHELYPWTGLEASLRTGRAPTQVLLGYGSLISEVSARRTFPTLQRDRHVPVVAFGVRRLLDYRMPPEVLARWASATGEPAPLAEMAALNARFTADEDDMVCGRLIPLDAEDIPALRQREKAYDLRVAPYVEYRHPQNVGLAYVLCATDRPWQGRVFVKGNLPPCLPYLALCRDAARSVSEEFLALFDRHTYLGDGLTRLADADGYGR